MFFPHDMETLGVSYYLKGIVRCLNIRMAVFFFAISQKSESVDINLHESANQTCNSFTINPVVCKSVSKDSCSTKEVKLDQKVTSYKKDNRVKCNN